ncbi:MAG: GMC family oxidoreductase [Lamprobacter sp.]|uniref:GMC family oxidoreductase n=1 Tax=Lamprobacter sp. TaxID=3100796 RepID=UPI002B25BCBF|nr:GMC family oxidoreductase [Lamprobacter sp.]MEA3641979.1 GMC family oxidoreductase [Lamprobacter sp.]
MLIDARSLDDNTQIDADLAIIGAGPAGISLARRLASQRINICLIESGGLGLEADTQDLYRGETPGLEYPLSSTRLRYFGGTSGHWGGYCRPLDPIDFERRDWVPLSGWPFGREALDPYWELASETVEVAPAQYENGDYWAQATGESLVDWRAGRFNARFFQFSPPTRFGERYRGELERSPSIRVLLHSNLTNIAALPSARAVDHLQLQSLNGRKQQVRAKRFVLAAGGIENARLLLLSNDVMPTGIGNQNDRVGRCFMEHPHLGGFADIVIADIRRLPRIYRERVLVDGRHARVCYIPRADFLRRERLLSASFTMSVIETFGPESTAATAVTEQHQMLAAAQPFLTDRSAAHIDCEADREVDPSAQGQNTGLGVRMGIGCACEQTPNPNSRVTLSDETDALGLRRTRLDWRLTEQDRRSLLANIHALGRELGATGIGRMRPRLPDDGQWEPRVSGGSHHMGTTRMSDDPKQGVVDRDCRVHGIDNLYIAGSSIFPTCGSANPTLNILALSYRLADHLERQST